MIWRRRIVTVSVLLVSFWIIHIKPTAAYQAIEYDNVEYWANSIGQLLNTQCSNASRIKDLENFYRQELRDDTEVVEIHGRKLVQQTVEKIEAFLRIRFNSVKKIKQRAESLFSNLETENRTFTDGCGGYQYYNAKTLQLYKPRLTTEPPVLDENSTYIPPTANDTYFLQLYADWSQSYDVPVSLNSSAVHVPTNIYECSPSILSNISWSADLDDVFMKNHDSPSMSSSWQYFASSEGFLRYYPASKWNTNDGIDMYDSRLTEWYTQAATIPKNVIIMLDASGSMTGLRNEIAMTTVNKLLESLQENDFFNLIVFRDEAVFADPCEFTNGTLLQATAWNKRRIMDSLTDLELNNRADFGKAYTLAFNVLLESNSSKKSGVESNNAIMVVTDGAPGGHKDVFEQYNWYQNGSISEVWVRVFMYLIGQEVTASNQEQALWMACANKGYFYHIATMADVHDYVQDYARVMARPLVVHNVDHNTWTGVHVEMPSPVEEQTSDYTRLVSRDWTRLPSDADSPKLSISVAMPVYNLNQDVRNEGKLLGVAGTDVLIDEIREFIPRPELGVNGYAFIINNNGFVVMHPDYSPWVEPCNDDTSLCDIAREGDPSLKTHMPKPDYKNVDITYLEQEAYPSDSLISELRKAMIDRKTGYMTVTVKKFFDKTMRRSYISTQTYHYAPIADTPYSLALVLKEPSDNKQVILKRNGFSTDLEDCRTSVAEWNYCNFSKDMLRSRRRINLLKDVLYGNNTDNKRFYRNECNDKLIKSLVYDARATNGMFAVWQSEQDKYNSFNDADLDRPCTERDKKQCERDKLFLQLSRTLRINTVLLGTRAGLTRYHEVNKNTFQHDDDRGDPQSCPLFTKMNFLPSLDSEYYRRAAISEKNKWIFDVKVPSVIGENITELSITASRGIYIKNQRNSGRDYDEILVSVMGLSIDFPSMTDIFFKATQVCHDLTMDCDSVSKCGVDLDCYLLDENGYIIQAEYRDDVGKFFGNIDYQIMLDMTDQNIFQQIHMLDYQALCTVCRTNSSSASRLLDPLLYLSQVAWWTFTKVSLFIIEFSLKDWWRYIYYATASSTDAMGNNTDTSISDYDTGPCIQDLSLFSYHDSTLTRKARGEIIGCTSCNFYDYETTLEIHEKYNGSIVRETVFDVGEDQNRTEICTSTGDKYHKQSYAVNRVQHTNLYFLVLESNCKCDKKMLATCRESHEVYKGCSETTLNRYRRPPETYSSAQSNRDPESEKFWNVRSKSGRGGKSKSIVWRELETMDCGRSSTLTLSLIPLLLTLLIALHHCCL